jgi:hypothetical protein
VTRAASRWNFDVDHAFGTCAAEDANLRAHEAIQRVLIDLRNLGDDGKYASCQKFRLALSESVEAWLEAFLVSARTIAAEVCRPVLSETGDLWTRCEADYRTGFKEHVRRHLKKWFEEQAPRSMRTASEEGQQVVSKKDRFEDCFATDLERAEVVLWLRSLARFRFVLQSLAESRC